MHINDVDLNLLRLFDGIYSTRNVSRAAERLNLTQPSASQGLARLRAVFNDPLFERVSVGVRPSPQADRLAPSVRAALAILEHALAESGSFTPASSRRRFRLHMSDVGAGRFLPKLSAQVRQVAPYVDIETQHLVPAELAQALDIGRIDFAFGFLPHLKGMQRLLLMRDRYVVLVHRDHPFAALTRPSAQRAALAKLDFVAVSTHADTLRILQTLALEERIRLHVEHFYVLPEIVRGTDLASVIPYEVARKFPSNDFSIIDPGLPDAEFEVYLHWPRRFEHEAGNIWLRQLITELFADVAGSEK